MLRYESVSDIAVLEICFETIGDVMKSLSQCRKQLVLFGLLILAIGCDTAKESKPNTPSSKDSNPPTADNVSSKSELSPSKSSEPVSGSSEKTPPANLPGDQKSAANSAPTHSSNEPNQSSSALLDPTEKSTQQEPVKPSAPPVAKPTAEQLARWKVEPFEPLQMLAIRDHRKTGFISSIIPTGDGLQLLLGGTKLALWAIDGEQSIHDFVEATSNEEERMLCFAVSPQGDWCVAGDAAGRLRKFSIGERKQLAERITNTNAVVQLAISPDGKEIATVPYTSDVIIWDAETLEKKTSFSLDTRQIEYLQFLAPQVLLASGETMSTWDSAAGTKLKTFPTGRYQSAIALSGDGKKLIFGGEDFLQGWNTESDAADGEYRGVPFRDSDVEFAPDGKLLAVASGDAVRILDVATGRMLQIIDSAGSPISDVQWAPKKPILFVANDSGQTRIWGRKSDADSMGLNVTETANVATNASPQFPATVQENLTRLDLRVLPKLPDSKPQSDYFHSISYAASADSEEIKAFYRYLLGERGWTEVVNQTTQYALAFQKDGFSLSVSSYGDKPGETYVSLNYLGNYDLRKAPRLDEVTKEKLYEGPTTVIYKVSANLLQIETGLLEKFHDAGWTAIIRMYRSQNESNEGRDFEFVKNGTVIRIMVQKDPMNPQLFTINYAQSLTLNSLPIPAEVGLMEWDDFAEARVVAYTKSNIEQATRFFEEEMIKHGWTARRSGRPADQEAVYLSYYWGQREVTVGLEPAADGMVQIRAGKYEDTSNTQVNEAGSSADTDESNTPPVGLEAADLPILHAQGAPIYRSNEGSIRVELEKVSLPELSQKYSDAMKSLGWETKPFGDAREDWVSLHFAKDGKTISYQSSIDPLGAGHIEFSGNGLLWSKPIPIKQLVSFTAWLRNHRYPATLQRLGEYREEMEKLMATTADSTKTDQTK